MIDNIYLMPNQVSMMFYNPIGGKITIETITKMIEISNKNMHYFELLVNNIAKNIVTNIDMNDKLSVPESDFKYEKCIAFFKRNVIAIEYDKDEDGLIRVVANVGDAVSYDNSYEDYKEMMDELIKNKIVVIKIPVIVQNNFDIPDFSKIKKLKI